MDSLDRIIERMQPVSRQLDVAEFARIQTPLGRRETSDRAKRFGAAAKKVRTTAAEMRLIREAGAVCRLRQRPTFLQDQSGGFGEPQRPQIRADRQPPATPKDASAVDRMDARCLGD